MTCDAPVSASAARPSDDRRGVFVTFEGGEGAGKSTHVAILAAALRAQGREVACLREPGGTSIGEQLRAVVLDRANDGMAPLCELFVYEAARAQIVREKIAPALARGAVVLCDRFCDSTLAYQAHGRGIDEAAVRRANELACQGIAPDRTIVLEASSAASGLKRAAHVAAADRLEQEGEAFHARVRAAFRALAAAEPARMRPVASCGSIEETALRVFAELADLFPGLSAEAVAQAARAEGAVL